MKFQPGDRVYHTMKLGYATVVYPISDGVTLIEFDKRIGHDYPNCKPGHAWRADDCFLELISEAVDDTPISIANLL